MDQDAQKKQQEEELKKQQEEADAKAKEAKAKAEQDEKDRQKKIDEMSPEELEEAQNAFLSKFYPETVKDPVAKKVEEKEEKANTSPEPTEEEKKAREAEEAAKKIAEEEAAKKEKEKAEAAKKNLPPEIDEFKTKEPKPAVREPEPEKAPAVDSDGFTARDRKYLAVLDQMGKTNPDHKNLKNRHIEYLKKEAAHIQAWLKENPGEKYNPNDHADFYDKHLPVIDEGEFEDAKEALIEEKVMKKVSSKVEATQQKDQNKRAIQESQQKAAVVAHVSIMDMFEKADDQLSGLVTERNGIKLVTNEDFEQIKENAPLVYDVLMEEAEPLSVMVSEMERLFMLPGVYAPDEKFTVKLAHSDHEFPVHKEIIKFVSGYEEEMLKKPAEETARDGKRLVSQLALNEAIEKVNSRKDLSQDEKAKIFNDYSKNYYTLGSDDFRKGLIEKYSDRTKKKIEKIKKQGVSFTLKKVGSEQKPNEPKKDKSDSQGVNNQDSSSTRRAHPSTTSTSDRTDTGKRNQKSDGLTEEAVMNKMFGV